MAASTPHHRGTEVSNVVTKGMSTTGIVLIGMFALNGLPRLYHPSSNYALAHRATDEFGDVAFAGGILDQHDLARPGRGCG